MIVRHRDSYALDGIAQLYEYPYDEVKDEGLLLQSVVRMRHVMDFLMG